MDIKLKTRKQMEKDIPVADLGWWYDVCPGLVIKNVRQAAQEDLDRCFGASSKEPKDYLVENFEGGSLINKKAVAAYTLSKEEIEANFIFK